MKKLMFSIFILGQIVAHGQRGNESISYWKAEENFTDNVSGFDKRSGIVWTLMNDQNYLYLKLISTDSEINEALISDGFMLYFDTLKQKNKSNYLKYTNEPGSMKPYQESSDQNDPFQENPGFTRKPDMATSGRYNKAIWQGIPYNLDLEKTDFSATFYTDTTKRLICTAVIPFWIINSAGLNSINRLSVGLEIIIRVLPSEAMRMKPPSGDRKDLPMGGNMPAGGNPHGQGGPPHGDGMEPQPSSKSLAKFWFLVQLAYNP